MLFSDGSPFVVRNLFVNFSNAFQDLYESCSNFRTTLCRNAADITNEKILGDILRANDQVTQVIKRYEQMKQKSSASPSKPEHSTVAVDKEYLTSL